IDWELDPLALVSTAAAIERRGVRYHQEFDSEGMFGFRPCGERDRREVRSFVNCMPQIACWPVLESYRERLQEFVFGVHGIDGPAGNLQPVAAIAEQMVRSG